MTMHLKLYQGYVDNTNKVISLLNETKDYVKDALQRRFSWEYNGMVLHELYFESILSKNDIVEKSDVYRAIKDQYGSIDQWREEFIQIGKMRGIGWVILYLSKEGLVNCWIDEHNNGGRVNGIPLLVMDVWEHAYITVYGTDRPKYINDFLKAVDWEIVDKRFHLGKQFHNNK